MNINILNSKPKKKQEERWSKTEQIFGTKIPFLFELKIRIK